MSPWRTKWTFGAAFILAEIDHLGDPHQRVKLEVLYGFISWTCAVIGELLYIVPRNTVFTETFRSEVLQYEVICVLC